MCMLLFGCDSGTKNKPAPAVKPASKTKSAAPDVKATPDTAPPVQAKPEPVPDKPKSPPPPPPPSSAAGPKWEIENVVYDFGAVWAGKEVRHPFEIRNVGDQTLNIDRPKARCSCSAAESYSRQVPPNGTGVIPFLLKTTNKVGPVNEWLTIGTNDPLRPEMKIWMRGIVKTVCTPEVIADESIAAGARGAPGIEVLKKRKAHFGNITSNQSLYRVIRLTNATDAPLSLELLDAPRAILKVNSKSEMIPNPFQASIEEVEPGQVFELTVTGKPPFQVGTTTMGINFKTNIPDQPYYAMAATAYVPARIEVRPYKIVTNLQANTKLRTIRIVNNGTTPFKITSFATSDPTYRLRRVPTKPSERNTDKFELMLPPGNYIPPSYGEVVRFETTDAEKPIIDIPVLPDLRKPPTARPANLPIQWTPGKQ